MLNMDIDTDGLFEFFIVGETEFRQILQELQKVFT